MNFSSPTLIAAALLAALVAAHASTVVASIYAPCDGIVKCNDYSTSSGQRYDAEALKCAAPPGTFPLGTRLYLRHGANAAEVVVNDTGPFIKNRQLDCTPAVDKVLHLDGLGRVRVDLWPPLPVPRKRP
jgi:rare lipoprotein A (peptidoglycan hydrolase)